MDLDRALEMYGTKEEGTRGRSRKYPDLVDAAREVLRQAEDPKIEIATRAEMKKMEDRGSVTTTAYEHLDVHLKSLEAARRNKAELEAFVKEMDDLKRGAPPIPSRAAGSRASSMRLGAVRA